MLCLSIFHAGTIGIMLLMVKLRQRKIAAVRRRNAPIQRKDDDPNTHTGTVILVSSSIQDIHEHNSSWGLQQICNST